MSPRAGGKESHCSCSGGACGLGLPVQSQTGWSVNYFPQQGPSSPQPTHPRLLQCDNLSTSVTVSPCTATLRPKTCRPPTSHTGSGSFKKRSRTVRQPGSHHTPPHRPNVLGATLHLHRIHQPCTQRTHRQSAQGGCEGGARVGHCKMGNPRLVAILKSQRDKKDCVGTRTSPGSPTSWHDLLRG